VNKAGNQEKTDKKESQSYKRADYSGQKVQIDVKFVPSCCVIDGCKYYQYTAVDEYSTYRLVDFL
jgi:hypothetical protein